MTHVIPFHPTVCDIYSRESDHRKWSSLLIRSRNDSSALNFVHHGFHRILVRGFEMGCRNGKKFDAHLTILHPYRLNQLQKKEDMIWVKKKIDQDAAKDFDKIASDLLKNGKISYEFRSEVGFINDRVQEHARKNNTLFLVIGKDFATENKEALSDLIAQTEVPLVIIPATNH